MEGVGRFRLAGVAAALAVVLAGMVMPARADGWRPATPLQSPQDADYLLARSAGHWAPPRCVDDGVSGPRVQPVFVYREGRNNRYPQFAKILQRSTYLTTGVFERSSGTTRTVRWVHDAACQPVFWQVAVPASETYYLSTLRAWLRKNDPRFRAKDRVFSLWVDGRTSSSWSGLGDDRWSAVWSSSYGFIWVDAHELIHALGAVKRGAPHQTGKGHAYDGNDIMSYADGGSKWRKWNRCPQPEARYRLDCGQDDYFAVSPRPGSWLAKHPKANVANSRFLAIVPPRGLPVRPLPPIGVNRDAASVTWVAEPGLRYDVGYVTLSGGVKWLGQDVTAGSVSSGSAPLDARLFVRAVNDSGYSKRAYAPDL